MPRILFRVAYGHTSNISFHIVERRSFCIAVSHILEFLIHNLLQCTSIMAAQCSYWYLEHVSTGKKLILQTGDNIIGRHSCCKIVLRDYDFVSRQHAKFIVVSENVSVEQLVSLLFIVLV